MSNLGTIIGEDINKYSGLSTVDAGLSAFTNSETFNKVKDTLTVGGTSLRINNTSMPITASPTGVLTSAFNGAISNMDNTLNISKYTVPTRLTLDAFTLMGQDIDKALSKSFLLQTLHIKGTDILCAVFCFLISMLSCHERGDIYNALMKANELSQQLEAGAKAVNNIVNTVGATIASGDAIMQSAKDLFSGTAGKDNIKSVIAAASTIGAAPYAITSNIEIISKVFKLASKQNLMLPNVASLNTWDMSGNVLHCLQGQAVQAADEILSKLTNPIEEKIRAITPQPCFGTMAVRFQQSIIDAIERFKQWLLTQVADLFTGFGDFNANFLIKADLSITALELIAITAALTNITAHFFDIANSCGIAPCNENNPQNPISRDANNVSNRHNDIEPINGPRYTNNIFAPPSITGSSITELATKLAPALGIDTTAPQIFVTPEEILAVHSISIVDMPGKIKDLISKGALDPNLDSNYTVYVNQDAINVVYRYDKKCGEK